jgi:hypothetical protein
MSKKLEHGDIIRIDGRLGRVQGISMGSVNSVPVVILDVHHRPGNVRNPQRVEYYVLGSDL